MALEVGLGGMWVLQALCGVETLPVALRCPPFIPSRHADLLTGGGAAPISSTPEYRDLRACGAVDADGRVDEPISSWLAIIGRPDREITLAIRRPGTPPTEQVMVICRRDRYLAKIARHTDRILLDTVGVSSDPEWQTGLVGAAITAAIGEYEAADIRAVNIPTGKLQAGRDPAAVLARAADNPRQAAMLGAATRAAESALSVIIVVDHGATDVIGQRILSIADTRYGRIMFNTGAAADGQQWLSAQPGTPTGIAAELGKLLRAA